MTDLGFHTTSAAPVNLRGLRLDKCPTLPREIKGEISASVEETTFPYAPTIRSCSTSSGHLSKKPLFPYAKQKPWSQHRDVSWGKGS